MKITKQKNVMQFSKNYLVKHILTLKQKHPKQPQNVEVEVNSKSANISAE